MKIIDQLQENVQSLSDADIDALEAVIHQTRAARVDARNQALAAFVKVVAEGQGVPIEVTRESAIALLAAGSHRLYSPDGGKAE
jgi:hypothetical protein